jgi:general secretion pathway protein C
MVNRYFTIANIILITAGIYLLVNGFYTITTSGLDNSSTMPPRIASKGTASSETKPNQPISQYSAIVERNLFNTSRQQQETNAQQQQKIDLENLKQTDLKLKLWGTVTRIDGLAYAVIEDTKTREQNLYRTGDSIDNATVKMILREKVVLTVNEQDEILTMEEVVASKRSIRGGRPRSDTLARKLPVSGYPRKITLNRERIESALENLGELMDQATIRPHIEDGAAAGISITGIKPNALFRRMRLRNGDIITGVNGRAIESVEDAISIFEDFNSASELKIDIKRRGRNQTLDYRIE